jgi:NAD(P)-dependent dehydrogenase (short-subunit alcohol dehydrogenase family)
MIADYKDLAGKVYFVTGASSGIGAGIATYLAESGANLVLHYHQNPEGMERTLKAVEPFGVKVVTVQQDYRQLDQVSEHFNLAWQAFGHLDGLVNNAGMVTKSLSLKDPNGDLFQQTLAVNLHAPYLLSTAFAQACIQAGQSGVIVNNSSIHGEATCEWFAAYAASKAGLEAIGKVQAVEWGEHQIRVNAVAPGVVPVERTESILLKPNVKAKWENKIPLGRYGLVEDIAQATAFLLSDASAWMTGQTLLVDGGMIARGNYPSR